ncbi:hypothetical protein BH20GEM1_BH20GEM1_15880 [soil metagenome]
MLGLPLSAVLGALTELEILGIARACPGQRYALPLASDPTAPREVDEAEARG